MKTMGELEKLWEELGDVPIDDDGYILKPFQHFEVGADRVEIWHWFEAQNPKFCVTTHLFKS